MAFIHGPMLPNESSSSVGTGRQLSTPSGPVTYNERPGSPTESYKGQVYTVQRVFDVAWGDRWSFVLGLLGDSSYVTDAAAPYGAYVKRFTPSGYSTALFGAGSAPHWMYPTSVDSIEPLGADMGYDADDVATYTRGDAAHAGARITVTYEGTHYKVFTDSDMLNRNYFQIDPTSGVADESGLGQFFVDESLLVRYCSVFVQPTAEYLSLPFSAAKWVEINDTPGNRDPSAARNGVPPMGTYVGAPVTNSVGRLIPSTEVNIIWHMAPKVPSAMYTGIGSVNAFQFKDPYDRFDAPPGTMLLTNAELKPYRWIGGKYLFDVSYKFKFFNPKPRPGDPGYTGDAYGNPSLITPNNVGGTNQITHNHFLHYRLGTGGFDSAPVFRLLTDNGLPPPTNPLIPAPPDGSAGTPLYRSLDYALLFTPK